MPARTTWSDAALNDKESPHHGGRQFENDRRRMAAGLPHVFFINSISWRALGTRSPGAWIKVPASASAWYVPLETLSRVS